MAVRSKLLSVNWSAKFILLLVNWSAKFILLSARLECLLFCFRPDWNACYFREGAIDNDPFFGNAPFAYLLDISVRHEIGKRYSISIAEYA